MSSQAITDQLCTVRDYLRWAMSRFCAADLYYGHGTDNAWDDACALVLGSLHLPPDMDDRILDARLTSAEARCVAQRIEARVTDRTPVPYLTQEAWFMGLPFYVDERVLIPRSPFAELITNEFAPWAFRTDNLRILDLCTGSGCLAIACAVQFPDATVDAVDISADALAVAKINVAKHQVADRVRLIESDLFTKMAVNEYDIIISNPPYVTKPQIQALPDEYHHEPNLALFSDDEGLQITETILANAHDYLAPNGQVFIEVGIAQEAMMLRHPGAPITWIDFTQGGEGVFTLNRDELEYFTRLADMR